MIAYTREYVWPALWTITRELAILLPAALIYLVVRHFSQGTYDEALINAQNIYQFEQSIGIAFENNIQNLFLHTNVTKDLVNWMYIWGHWPVIIFCALMLFFTCPDQYKIARNGLIFSGLIGFIFFALIPTAPPRLSNVGLIDTVTVWSNSYRTLQPPKYTNIYAAMPSLHFGWNLILGICVYNATHKKAIKLFAVCMPIAMAITVVATANHWVLDVIIGFIVAMTGLIIARKLTPISDES